MSAHVLWNSLNELWKKDNMRGSTEHLVGLSQRVLMNSVIQDHESKILFII